MEIFLDTANIDEIKYFSKIGIIDGITTNPTILANNTSDLKNTIDEIIKLVNGPISIEVISEDYNTILDEARQLSRLNKNIVVKLPANEVGFQALNVLTKENIKTNLTIVYTANQALIAAKLGATYVSPFIGRLDATSTSGNQLLSEIVKIYNNYNFKTKIIAASMRNEIYVKNAVISGAHVVTVPPDVLRCMMRSELTDISLKGFLIDWSESEINLKNLLYETKK